MNKPLVSVIIPTYNRVHYIQEAIESVLAQSYKNYELIIIDDGSIDDTKKIIGEKYKDKVKYFYINNSGESFARNFGFTKSHGEFIAFLDSDDKWHPDKLLLMVNHLQKKQKKNKLVSIICSSVYIIDDLGKVINKRPVGRVKNIDKYNIFDFLWKPRIYAPPSNIIISRNYYELIGGFNEDIRYGEDWDFIIRLSEVSKFVYLDKPLTYYRIHNLGQQKFPDLLKIEKKLNDQLLVIENYSHNVDEINLVNRIKASYIEESAFWFFIYEKWNEGREKLILASNYDKNCTINVKHLLKTIPYFALEKAKYKIKNKTEKVISIKEIISDFNVNFFPNLVKIWPSDLLQKENISKDIYSRFCHSLAYDKEIYLNKKDMLFLIKESIFYNKRYIFSIRTWIHLMRKILF